MFKSPQGWKPCASPSQQLFQQQTSDPATAALGLLTTAAVLYGMEGAQLGSTTAKGKPRFRGISSPSDE